MVLNEIVARLLQETIIFEKQDTQLKNEFFGMLSSWNVDGSAISTYFINVCIDFLVQESKKQD